MVGALAPGAAGRVAVSLVATRELTGVMIMSGTDEPPRGGFGHIDYPRPKNELGAERAPEPAGSPDSRPLGEPIRPYHPGMTTREIRDVRPPEELPAPPPPSRPTRRGLLAAATALVSAALLVTQVAQTSSEPAGAAPTALVCASVLTWTTRDIGGRGDGPERILHPWPGGTVWEGDYDPSVSPVERCRRAMREFGQADLVDPVVVSFGMNPQTAGVRYVIPRSQVPAGDWPAEVMTVTEP